MEVNSLAYLQVILLFAGTVISIGHFGSNHYNRNNRSNGATHYAWFHPRFLTLATTAVSSGWLVIWPIVSVFAHSPLRGTLVSMLAIGLCALGCRWLNLLRRIGLCVLMVPLVSLAVGGMPSDMSWTANLAILNIAPTLYVLYHKGENRLRDIARRHDIAGAYVIWALGHLVAYWSLVAISFKVAGPTLLWTLLHGRVIGRVLGAMMVAVFLILIGRWIVQKIRGIRWPRAHEPVRPADQQAPRFIIE